MSKRSFIPLFQVFMSPDAPNRVKEVLLSGYIGQGEKVDQFEKKFEELECLNRKVLTTSSGTAALDLAFHLIGIGPGTKVISTPATCLSYCSPILLSDGKTEQIGKIVRQKKKVSVRSVNPLTGNIENRMVKNWIKIPAKSSVWYRLRLKNCAHSRGLGGKRGVWVTGDHEVLTKRGFVRVDQLEKHDFVATGQRMLNDKQMEVMNGTLLGDSSITMARKAHNRFSCTHTESQAEWFNLKLSAFQGIPFHVRSNPARKQTKLSLTMESKGGVQWRVLRSIWYGSRGSKKIPHNLILTPLTLATWYMDDGSLTTDSDSAVFCTDGFSVEAFWNLFWKVAELGLKPTALPSSNKKGLRLRIGNGPKDNRHWSALKLFSLIGPYIPKSMRYKVPKGTPEYNPCLWAVGSSISGYDQAVAVQSHPPKWEKPAFAYCIEVEGTHTFLSGDIVFKNCLATNTHLVLRGAEIIWADVDPKTGLLSLPDIRAKMTSDIKAIVAVDWGGARCDYKALRSLGPPVVQDGAHSLLAKHLTFGHYRMWSFQAIKHLTCGDGGALLMPEAQYERAKRLRWYGLDRSSNIAFRCKQNLPEVGYKYHMNDISAAIGLANMPFAEWVVEKHRENAMFYERHISDRPSIIEKPPWSYSSSWWLYTVLVEDRKRFEAHMKAEKIAASPVHARNDEKLSMPSAKEPLPGVDSFMSRECCIPVGWWLNDEDLRRVTNAVNSFE